MTKKDSLPRIVHVDTLMQKGYSYVCNAPIGKQFDVDFKPDLTPKEMLELGVFGGLYMSDKPAEFPREWFLHAKLSPDRKRHAEFNYFGVNASQS